MKWIEVADEENWDQVRQIFEPSAEKPHHAGLHTEVLIRRGNPADQILEEADTWGADCIFVGAKGRGALIVCCLVVFPFRFPCPFAQDLRFTYQPSEFSTSSRKGIVC